ncbi:MAG: hypothetical protein ACRDJW_18785 [Thermomicrobiales bacterium]
MGIFDRFHGQHATERGFQTPADGLSDKEAAAHYRTLLATAPPETIELAHASAFAQLTPEQRQMILAELGHEMPPFEWETGARYADEPRSLARMATRAELEHPGIMERLISRLDLPAGASAPGGFARMIVGSWAASQFFAESVIDRPTGDGERISPTVGHDVVIGEQTLQSDRTWRHEDDGLS